MPMQSSTITIGQLSQRSGVNIETIRYYERIGLPPMALRQGTASISTGRRMVRFSSTRIAKAVAEDSSCQPSAASTSIAGFSARWYACAALPTWAGAARRAARFFEAQPFIMSERPSPPRTVPVQP